jgi:hypothetical protein
MDRRQRRADAVAQHGHALDPGLGTHLAHHAGQAGEDVVPGEVAVFCVGLTPIETPHVETARHQGFDQTRARTQVKNIPAIDQGRHQQHRQASPRLRRPLGVEPVQPRGTIGHHGAARGLGRGRCVVGRTGMQHEHAGSAEEGGTKRVDVTQRAAVALGPGLSEGRLSDLRAFATGL